MVVQRDITSSVSPLELKEREKYKGYEDCKFIGNEVVSYATVLR